MRISDWSSDVCSSDLAQVSILSGATQADAEVAAGGPAAGQEAYAPAAGRAPERQAPAHAIEALQHGVVRLWLIVAVGIPVKDPAVAPGRVSAAGVPIDRKSTRLNSSP